MSAISAAAASSSNTSERASRFNELSSEDFIRLITTELTKQDPLKPNDTNTLLTQISSIRQIESDLSVTKNFEQLISQSQFSTAGNLIGLSVSGLSERNQRVEGVVTSVSRTSNGAVLTVRDLITGVDSRVNMNNLDQVNIQLDSGPNPDPVSPQILSRSANLPSVHPALATINTRPSDALIVDGPMTTAANDRPAGVKPAPIAQPIVMPPQSSSTRATLSALPSTPSDTSEER